jgi:hypothetical protein
LIPWRSDALVWAAGFIPGGARPWFVGTHIESRAALCPAWVMACAEALWRTAPVNATERVVRWAMGQPDPPVAARAVVAAYQLRLPEKWDAVDALRLLDVLMADLGDAQGNCAPNASRKH